MLACCCLVLKKTNRESAVWVLFLDQCQQKKKAAFLLRDFVSIVQLQMYICA